MVKHRYSGRITFLFHYEIIYDLGPLMLEKQDKESQSRVVFPQSPRQRLGHYRWPPTSLDDSARYFL